MPDTETFDGYAGAIARLAAKKAQVDPNRVEGAVRTYVSVGARPLNFYLVDGEVPEGDEPSGRLFPFRVLDNPAQYLVIGEISYSDGRRFLDFGLNPAWVETNSDYRFIPGRSDNPVSMCPDCEAIGGEHMKISIPDRDGGRPLLVKCPRDLSRTRR